MSDKQQYDAPLAYLGQALEQVHNSVRATELALGMAEGHPVSHHTHPAHALALEAVNAANAELLATYKAVAGRLDEARRELVEEEQKAQHVARWW